MKELYLVVKREYLARVRKKSFIFLTILMPILIMGSIFLPIYLSANKEPELKRIVVVDDTNMYGKILQSDNNYIFENIGKESVNTPIAFSDQIYATLKIQKDLSIDSQAVYLYSEKQIPQGLLDNISRQLSAAVRSQYIQKWFLNNNLDAHLASQLQGEIDKKDFVKISTLRMAEDIANESSAILISTVSLGLTFFMYFFILMYGTMVLNGVVEEKSNRIVEILICTLNPYTLMMGKIIGIGLVGLTQFFIWLISGVIILGAGYFFVSESIAFGAENTQLIFDIEFITSINWAEILLFFLLHFIGGYLIYASLFAMFGASVDNAQDAQQFVLPITTLFVFALYAALYSLQNPDQPLAFWCSIIPFTSPVVMMVRIPFGVPWWEKVLSIVLLYGAIVITAKVSARVYRMGILMHGKKLKIKDFIKLAFTKK